MIVVSDIRTEVVGQGVGSRTASARCSAREERLQGQWLDGGARPVAREPDDDNDHWVEQTAVLYPPKRGTPRGSSRSRASIWEKCAEFSVAVDDRRTPVRIWEIDDGHRRRRLITQIATQEDADGWDCQHALSAASNFDRRNMGVRIRDLGDEAAAMSRIDIVERGRRGRQVDRCRPTSARWPAGRPPVLSASSSARITCTTALISARWVNACGKLPRWRPVRGSISSA